MRRDELSFSLSVYPWDFTNETLRRQLETIKAWGIDRITCATLYHDGRQALPKNSCHRFALIKGGVSYVDVAEPSYPDSLTPARSRHEPDLGTIVASAADAGLEVAGWSVCLHRDDLIWVDDERVPKVENVFGDRSLPYLCPCAPAARTYLAAHLRDMASAGVTRVSLEGFCFPTYAHGAHHESLFVPLDDYEQWLASLCFCRHCLARADSRGAIDPPGLRHAVTSRLEDALRGVARDAELGDATYDEQLLVYAELRSEAVTELVEELARPGPVLQLADQATIAGDIFRTGRPGPRPSAENGWRYGLDYGALQRVAQLALLGYLRDIEHLKEHVAAYLALGVSADRAAVALRPLAIDSPTRACLVEKIEYLEALGVRDIVFYNYSFARECDLNLLGSAIAARQAA